MKRRIVSILAGVVLLSAIAGILIIVDGCASPRSQTSAGSGSGAAAKTAPTGKGGAELWAFNCSHCHNIRSPNFYNDAQWDVSMMHMRVRANLTAEEYRKILAFLQSAD